MDYLMMEIGRGIWILLRSLPGSLAIFLGVMIVELSMEYAKTKRIERKFIQWIFQFLWIWIIVSILKITGIIGGKFELSLPIDSYISLKIFEEGINAATILNIFLFVPYGFFSVFAFKNFHKHWWNGIIIGAIFSFCIEFLQLFVGRYVQLDDVLFNTCGTFVGFLLGKLMIRVNDKRRS